MVFPYENFHWSVIDLDTRYEGHRFRVVVHPNIAKVVDLITSQTISIFEGEDREERAIADAIERLKYWDNHVFCCWQPKPFAPEVIVRERKRTRRN